VKRTRNAATHDYKRHGVVDLYAALEVATGNVTHRLSDSHITKDFIGFMKKVVREYAGQELHVILDNSSSHSTLAVKQWLAAHPQVHFHHTPTSASWLNQIEGFFGILGKQSLSKTGSTLAEPSKITWRPTCATGTSIRPRSSGPSRQRRSSSHTVKMIDRISTTVH
jgi:transposase